MADESPIGTPDAGGAPEHNASSGPEASAAIQFAEDTRFIPPGQKDPVNWKDFSSAHIPRSEFTRMRQQDRAQIEAERKALKEQERQIQQAATQLAQRLGPQQPQGPDVFAQLEALPYVDGKTQAQVVRQIANAINQRDQALGLLHNRLQQLEKGYGTLSGQSQRQAISGLFSSVQQGLGLPDNPQIRNMIESEYHAHEGWDSVSPEERVQALTQIVKERVDGLKNYFQTEQQQRVQAARQTAPAQRIQQLRVPRAKGKIAGSETPAEMADALYPMFAGNPNT